MLLNPDIDTVNVPHLDKEITVQELGSHFFRNIHNQVKQQVGKAVRECVISVPRLISKNINQKVTDRLIQSAQAGGIRIKCMVDDAASALLAYGYDETVASAKVIVIDIGWGKSEISIYNVSSGLIFPINDVITEEISGKKLVHLLTEHCAKEFLRKSKVPCNDNAKSMMRLRRECEGAIKSLSTGTEAMVDIDSLCEGIDFSTKISRARFEDIISIPIVHLKKSIADLLASASLTNDSITDVCFCGGITAIPKISSVIKSLFPSATYPKIKFENCEVQCIGAVLHGKTLMKQSLLDKPPSASPTAVCLTKAIKFGDSVILDKNTALPTHRNIKSVVTTNTGFFKVYADTVHIADIAFKVATVPCNIVTTVQVDVEGKITVSVKSADADATELASLLI